MFSFFNRRRHVVAASRLRYVRSPLLFLIPLFAIPVQAAQTDISGPAGSLRFGTQVEVLPNGNFVVSDPFYNAPGGQNDTVGAVYLYDGATLKLISTLMGSSPGDSVGGGGITVLTNGDYVVSSPNWHRPVDGGAVTWCSATTGCDGVVSASNSLIGGTAYDEVGRTVTALTNGNYVVTSPFWDNPAGRVSDVGAVTWGNGGGGTVGLVTSSNSLIGGTAGDRVGAYCSILSSGVMVLTNGNYVVRSQFWDNPSPLKTDVGAVTWGNGAGGTVGLISSSNSLIGGTANDFVGGGLGSCSSRTFPFSDGVTILSNRNYVVNSPKWDNPTGSIVDAGAVTWCSATTGCKGVVSTTNSLIGGTANDQIGFSVTALTNGNYVVSSPSWDNPTGPVADVGAVTWSNGSGGTVGLVTPSNSLIGVTTSDQVGSGDLVPLTNGNYVVSSPSWDNPIGPKKDVGAVTWGNGTSLTAGPVTSRNSLVGGSANDGVGSTVTALTNGNYVVSSPSWDNPTGPVADVGAVTWSNGTGGTVGLVTPSNSLMGGTASDGVGAGGVTRLANGNYVVSSLYWDNPSTAKTDVGAVTWGNGRGGTVGPVTSANSLIGGTADDFVGAVNISDFDDPPPPSFISGVTALSNGNYVVNSPSWDNPAGPKADVGAVTLGNGAGGTVGLVTSGNSLIGGHVVNDGWVVVTALTNGNYVVRNSPYWDNPAGPVAKVGAVTWGNGSGGTVGTITLTNSLIGGTANDSVGNEGVTALADGNYMVNSTGWHDPTGPFAGAFTFCNGTIGTTGLITSANSVIGAGGNHATFGGPIKPSYDPTRHRYLVPRPLTNVVSIFSFDTTTAITDGNFDNAATWNNGVPTALVNVVIPAGRTVTVNRDATIGSLSIANGGTLTMNANLNLTGALTLGGKINTGTKTLGLSCSTSVFGASSSNYIIGRVKKDFCAPGAFVFPVGTTNGFSPVTANVTALTVNPSSLTVKAVQGPQPNIHTPAAALQRYWTLTASGITADLTFNYLDSDVPATASEETFAVFKYDGSFSMPGGSVNTALNQAKITGVSSFSDWTLAQPSPNQIDSAQFFVRQHYLDFLNREPDAAGLAFWTNEITSCGSDAQCIEVKRINVSAAFFLSIEFQQSGYLVYRFYKSSFGNLPLSPVPIMLSEFLSDAQQIGQGVIVGQAGWETVLENNKQTFASQFVQRSRFASAYPTSLSPAEFVNALFATAGVVPSTGDRAAAINEFGAASTTSEVAARARALRRVAENSILAQQEFNRAFVLMQYFGYLRRNPNDPPEATLDFQGYNFWLNKLNVFNGNFIQAEMVKAFIDSSEYRQRFSQP